MAHIERMMSGLTWERGVSNRELAKEWGVSVGAVNDYASEAGRRLRARLTDVGEVTEVVTARLQSIVRRGTDIAAIKAGDVWTRIVGARAPERTENVIMSPEQARAKYRELTGKEWGE